jgi:hypothetical protein
MRRTLRLLACAVAGIVLGLTVYSGLVHVGIARSLFAPTLRGYALGDRTTIPHDTYAEMQRRLAEGYSKLGAEVGARVAPAGFAWTEALRRKPGLDLWAADGQHPGRNGSYLAACVFYAALTGCDPTRSRFTAGIEAGQARFLQRVAENVYESDVKSGSA